MHDDPYAWAAELSKQEEAAFAEARRRFGKGPNAERLHVLRTAARRLRSLYEDLGTLLASPDQARLRRFGKRAGAARDAHVLRLILKSTLEPSERDLVAPLLHMLRVRERKAVRRVRRTLERYPEL
ncbi:MAG TPA: CHAD domain-containing protein [Candidatus Baltobacteraceae bacterium]|jgi:CHAD domain-containing protein|nr:CHAD domain-containing protein [Candidatus Baltobacteraceae bacterium]